MDTYDPVLSRGDTTSYLSQINEKSAQGRQFIHDKATPPHARGKHGGILSDYALLDPVAVELEERDTGIPPPSRHAARKIRRLNGYTVQSKKGKARPRLYDEVGTAERHDSFVCLEHSRILGCFCCLLFVDG